MKSKSICLKKKNNEKEKVREVESNPTTITSPTFTTSTTSFNNIINKHKVGYKRYENINERYKAFIDSSEFSEDTKKILWDWVNERKGNNFKDTANIGLLGTVLNIEKAINKDLTQITKKDLQNFFSNNQFKESQELWYKKSLKRFYKWLSINQDNPKFLMVVNWIDTKDLSKKCSQHSHKKREDNLLSPEEVRKMISTAILLRDKLAISLLADTGVRAESIGASKNNRSITVEQIKFYKGYVIIENIEEKFSKRRDVIVTEALSYLIKYWNELPEDYKKNKKNPLFIGYSTNRYGKRWGYAGLKGMLHKISKKTLGRIINPHDFRHLKGTRLHLDENLSDDAKCKLMGWSSRRMLDTYNHTTFDDAKEEYLAKKGIIKIDDKTKKKRLEATILKPKECLVCHHINSLTDTICENCGNSLDYESMIKDFTKRQKGEKELNKFFDSKEIQQLFKRMNLLQKQINKLKKGSNTKL